MNDPRAFLEDDVSRVLLGGWMVVMDGWMVVMALNLQANSL